MKGQFARNCREAWQGTAGRAAGLLEAGRSSWEAVASRLNLRQPSTHSIRSATDQAFDRKCYEALVRGQSSLKSVSQDIENCFLEIGTSLEKLPDISESLVSHSERLLGLASGRESGATTFGATMKLLEDPLAFIDRCQNYLQNLITRLETAIQEIDKLIVSEELLNRAVAPLTYIQINFKIESAGLSPAVQQMFMALTEDVDRLHRKVNQTFGEKFAMLRTARATLKAVANQLKEDAKNQGRILREKRSDVARALAELEGDLKKNEGRDIQLTHVSRAINQQVGQLVMLLQTQDIVSQKLAHVGTAIAGIYGRYQSGTKAITNESRIVDFGYCEVSCRLQDAQLDAIGTDLRQADAGIFNATKQINDQIVQLDQECLCLSEFDRVTAGVDGLVQVLLDTIQEVRGMAHNAVSTAEQAYTALRPIGGLASNLTSVMRDLSAQIHLIALNAQVQAAHNCSGTGLEVLASGTANVSNVARGISERVAAGVDALTVELDQLVESLVSTREEGVRKRDLMENEARQQEAGLHAMRDETLKELLAVSGCVQQIRSLAGTMAKANRLQSIVGNEIENLRQDLMLAAAETMAHLEQLGEIPDPHPFSDELSRCYTVASEHAAHLRIFATPPAAKPTASEPADALFFDDLPGTESHMESVDADSMAATAALVVANDRATPGITPPDEKKDASLGDNVDLF